MDGTWARYGSRAQSARKISGSCENFRNSSRCLQAIVDLPCPFSRVRGENRCTAGFYASIMRGTGAMLHERRSGEL